MHTDVNPSSVRERGFSKFPVFPGISACVVFSFALHGSGEKSLPSVADLLRRLAGDVGRIRALVRRARATATQLLMGMIGGEGMDF